MATTPAKRPPLSPAFRAVRTAGIAAAALFALTASAQTPTSPAPVVSAAEFDHVTLSVANIDRMAAWYEKVFGFKVAVSDDSTPGTVYRQLRTPTLRLDLVQYKGSARAAAAHPVFLQQGMVHLAFSVSDRAAALAVLKALNTDATLAEPASKTAPITVHDPEGNEIEIFARS